MTAPTASPRETCPQPVVLWKFSGRVRSEVLVACKRYTCPHCCRGRRRRIANHIDRAMAAAAAVGQRVRFVTFTYPRDVPAEVGVRGHVIDTSTRLRRVVQRLRRDGLRLEYGRVLEATKRDRIHVHALVWGDYLPKCHNAGRRKRGLPTGAGSGSPCYCTEAAPCIQRAAWDEGFGWVDVRAITGGAEAVGYVLKYLTKQNDRQGWPRHARRYSYSREFAGGVTLGQLDAEHLAPFLEQRRLEQLERTGRVEPVIWQRAPHRPLAQRQPWLVPRRRPPPLPIPWPPRATYPAPPGD